MTSDTPTPRSESSTIPYIILGLGNPGPERAGNRHNVGAQCVALFARRYKLRFERAWGPARVAQGMVAEQPVVLARSHTYMNESGLAAAALARRTGAPLAHLMVVCDDLDLPLGKLRLRARGSPGGHNGLSSIVQHLGSQEFPRLRIGIGHPYDGEERATRSRQQYEEDVVRWVLQDFSSQEEAIIQEVRERATDALLCWLTSGITEAMNRYN